MGSLTYYRINLFYRVNFPPSVQIMAIEFDPRCSTAQAEDSVRLYIPRDSVSPTCTVNKRLNSSDCAADEQDTFSSFIAILDKYSGRENWPKKAVILPGNEVLFSLETASDYSRAEKDHYFGFRCLVSGFEVNHHEGLQRLEMELAFLGGLCSYELVKKDIVLPPVSGNKN
jgi:E3 ubiquitin-protein ligase MYCBP2